MADTAVTLGAATAREESVGVGTTRTGFSPARMFAVMRKELRSYFAFPLVYIISGIFLMLSGWYAYTDLKFFTTISFSRDIIQNYWQMLLTDIRLGLLLTIPFITRRQFPRLGGYLSDDARTHAAVSNLHLLDSRLRPVPDVRRLSGPGAARMLV